MPYRVGQAVFAKGEISEELVARFDVASYNTALRKANNVVILKYGGVTKRPGLRLVSEVYKDKGVRLIPFQYSLEQPYVLEMGQGYARIAALGGMVIEDKLTVQSVTRGATTAIRADYHGYSVGDQVYFSGVVGCEDLNGKIARVISVTDANNFVVDINGSSFGALTSDTGGTIRTAPPPAPPTPPVVPPPAPDPAPPEVGSGGGGGRYIDGKLVP